MDDNMNLTFSLASPLATPHAGGISPYQSGYLLPSITVDGDYQQKHQQNVGWKKVLTS